MQTWWTSRTGNLPDPFGPYRIGGGSNPARSAAARIASRTASLTSGQRTCIEYRDSQSRYSVVATIDNRVAILPRTLRRPRFFPGPAGPAWSVMDFTAMDIMHPPAMG
jgi:hypothetical protein